MNVKLIFENGSMKFVGIAETETEKRMLAVVAGRGVLTAHIDIDGPAYGVSNRNYVSVTITPSQKQEVE